jgi:hypothetical protein
MRIIIESGPEEALSVSREGQPLTSAAPAEATDGGAAPQELLEALGAEPTEEFPEGEESGPREPEDAGEAPAWMIDIIEGGKPQGPDGSSEH